MLVAHAERRRSRAKAREPGFTLIEILSVLIIIALIAGVILPGLGVSSGRALRGEAQRLAADLELARERSAVLGVPHRLLVDLDGGRWHMEWLVTEAEAIGDTAVGENEDLGADATERDDHLLTPPRDAEVAFYPVPTSFGRDTSLETETYFVRIDTGAGPVSRGQVSLIFDRDGSTDPVVIVLRDQDGREIALDVEALDEAVGLRDGAG